LVLIVVALSASEYKWPAAIAATSISFVGLVTQELRFRRYRCPACHSRLAYTDISPGTRIEFHCPKCDIVWDTGFSATSDDSG